MKKELTNLRLRPYKSCDADKIISWVKDEDTFHKWGGDHFGRFPIDATVRSRLTNNVYRYHYKFIDGFEICDFLHELAIMDDIWIFTEEFNPEKDITLSCDEVIPVDVDE